MPSNTTCYVIAGTKYYRLASKAFLGQYGSNLQNIEKSARKMYITKAGFKFVNRDQSGAEALIVAYLCKNGNFRSLFLNGIKPHVFVALHLFKDIWQKKINEGSLDIKCDVGEMCALPIPQLKLHPFWKQIDGLIKSSDNWAAHERYYYIAKQVCHSSNYGIRANAFSLNTLEKSRGKVVIKKQEAEKFLTIYHNLFPEIREWHREVEKQVKATRMLFNLLGHPIYFSDDLESSENAIKEAYSAVPQSTVACITRKAVTDMQYFIELTNLEWDIVQDNHDSFMCQVPEKDDMECCKTMKEYLEQELVSPRGEKFRMKSEAQAGFNWSPYHPEKNTQGLKEVKE